MKRPIRKARVFALLFPALSACTGTTGGEILSFRAYAAGPEDAAAGQPYSFETSRGYSVTLTRARLHVGALYLNRSQPTSVGGSTSCHLSGIYVAEVTSGLDIDLLSPELQAFPAEGSATSDHARSGEVWLFGGGDINDPEDSTVILDVVGSARGSGLDLPFAGKITIGQNRQVVALSPAAPGANPICKQRIASPIPVDLDTAAGESLVLRVDPAGLFADVDFDALEASEDSPPLYRFRDDNGDAPSRELYFALHAASNKTYRITWEAGP